MRRWPFMKMTRTVTQALLGPSACRMYPVQPGKVYPNTRGRIEMDAAKCILCSICAKKCPTGALRVDRPGHTWEIDRFLCIQCGACAEACPQAGRPARDRGRLIFWSTAGHKIPRDLLVQQAANISQIIPRGPGACVTTAGDWLVVGAIAHKSPMWRPGKQTPGAGGMDSNGSSTGSAEPHGDDCPPGPRRPQAAPAQPFFALRALAIPIG